VDRSKEALVPPIPAPEDLLVSPPDGPLEVDAPGIPRRVKVQGFEGDPDLCRPAVRPPGRSDLPDSVPGLSAAAGSQKRIPHETGGIDLEHVPGAAVQEGVQHPHEPVVGFQTGVPGLLVGQDALRIVEEEGADVEVLPIVSHPDPGLLRGRRTFPGLLLREIRDGGGPVPDRLLQPAVQPDPRSFGDTVGAENVRRPALLRLPVLGEAGGRRGKDGSEDQSESEKAIG